MKHNLFKDNSGVTLIELLLALFLFVIITIIIVSILVMGMNSTKNVQKDVSLHDEANYIMTQLVNVIYEATSVNDPSKREAKLPHETSSIEVENYHGDKTKLSFKKDEPLSDKDIIQSPFIQVSNEKSSFVIKEENVIIHLVVQDMDGEKELELTREISYVNVDKKGE